MQGNAECEMKPGCRAGYRTAAAGTAALAIVAATVYVVSRKYAAATGAGVLGAKTWWGLAIMLHGGLTVALLTFVVGAGKFSRRVVGNTIATAGALLMGTTTMFFSVFYLREPQIPLDWAVMVFSGITTGIVVFFLVWGHFNDLKVERGTGNAER